MEDLSDDVSALSMDGASTIGKNIAFKRLHMKISDVQRLGTIEDAAENDIDAMAAAAAVSATGEIIIEPFPKTFEEWKEKKEKKKKQKHKSSKKSHKKSRKKDKEREENIVDTSSANKLPPIPIKEIEIMSSSGGGSRTTAPSDCNNNMPPQSPARSNMSLSRKSRTTSTGGGGGGSSGVYSNSHNSITSSTDSTGNLSSSRRSSSILSGPGSSGIVTGRQSTTTITTTPRRSRHQHRPSELSASQKSSNSFTSHQSHVTIEKINQTKLDLERARLDEKQVLEIHHQLEMEVSTLEMKSHHFQQQRQQIQHELEIASSERYQLQCSLTQLQVENDKLRAKVRKAEDKEDKKRLDDVLDSMESKMRALKLQSKRSKEKKNKSSVERVS